MAHRHSDPNRSSGKTPPYFPFWTRDFVHACRTSRLSPDEVGALVVALCQQWEIQGPLSPDPTNFAAFSGWDIRVARRLLARLIKLEKLELTDVGIQSARMHSEIEKYVAKVRSAELRETEKAKLRQTSPELPSDFPDNSQRSSREVRENLNEINVAVSREEPLPESESEPDKKIRARNAHTDVRRSVAKVAFSEWQQFAKRLDLAVPRDTTFDVFGKKLATRLFEHADEPKGFDEMMAVFHGAMAQIERSSFLRGMTGNFRADLKFVCQRESFAKLISGGFGNGAHGRSRKPVSDQMRQLDSIVNGGRSDRTLNTEMIAAWGWQISNPEVTRE